MRSLKVHGSRTLPYAVAVLSAATAAGLRVSLTRLLGDRNELVMFYPAVMVTAWLGGLWPGVVATLESALLAAYLFLEPHFTLHLTHPSDRVALAIFLVTGVVISILNDDLRRVAASEQAARADNEQARNEADAANRTKDFFLAAVSHDLRAPMNATLGWVDMLSKHVLDEDQQDHAIEVIRRTVNWQLELVNDLLDRAAILSGTLRVERKRLDIAAVVRAAVQLAEPLAGTKSVHITFTCAMEHAQLVGDAGRIQQVLSNLLANAIKFTPKGGGIHVRLQRSDACAEIQVCDTGEGISAELLPFVFERFWRGARSSATEVENGVGLGLSIAKQLVVAHGGTIQAKSAGVGRGSTFTVRLPLAGNGATSPEALRLASGV